MILLENSLPEFHFVSSLRYYLSHCYFLFIMGLDVLAFYMPNYFYWVWDIARFILLSAELFLYFHKYCWALLEYTVKLLKKWFGLLDMVRWDLFSATTEALPSSWNLKTFCFNLWGQESFIVLYEQSGLFPLLPLGNCFLWLHVVSSLTRTQLKTEGGPLADLQRSLSAWLSLL